MRTQSTFIQVKAVNRRHVSCQSFSSTVIISYHPQTTCLLALNFSAELSGKIRLQREVQLNSILVDVKTLRHSQNPVKMITDIQKGSFWVTFAIKSCIRLNKNTLVAFILNATTLQ